MSDIETEVKGEGLVMALQMLLYIPPQSTNRIRHRRLHGL